MKFTLDEEFCSERGLNINMILYMLLIHFKADKTNIISELQNKKLIEQNLFGNPCLTAQGSHILEEILIDSATKKASGSKAFERYKELAGKMRELYPTGKIYNYPLKSGTQDTVNHLKMFFLQYGNKWTDEEILDAERRYIKECENGKAIRLLKYFIIKYDKVINEEGEGVINPISELMDFLENPTEEEIVNNADLI